MNLNGDEKRIEQLFREMGLEDARRAPPFACVLEAANRTAQPRARVGLLAVAVVAATLIVVSLLALVVARHNRTVAGPPQQAEAPAAQPQMPPVIDAPTPRQASQRRPVRHPHHRIAADVLTLDMKSLFAWQSPTASLLKSPSENLLIPLPRLGESLQTIKSYSPDLWN